jgi:hypothetical protein
MPGRIIRLAHEDATVKLAHLSKISREQSGASPQERFEIAGDWPEAYESGGENSQTRALKLVQCDQTSVFAGSMICTVEKK